MAGEKKKIKIIEYLYYLNYNWSKKHKDTKTLLLLNIFHYLGNNEDFETLNKDLENYIEKLNIKNFVKPESFDEAITLYQQYLKWLNQFNSDLIVLKKPVSKLSENSIIFSKTYGFVMIKNLLDKNFSNLETPLGMYDEERNLFGFVEVFIGSQPVFF